MRYNHDTMFESIKSVWNDVSGCHWCGRNTNEPFDGHDGFCPVPAMLTLEADLAEERLLTIEHAGTIMSLKTENEAWKQAGENAVKQLGSIVGLMEITALLTY